MNRKTKGVKAGTIVSAKLEHGLGYVYGKIIKVQLIEDIKEWVVFYKLIVNKPSKMDLSRLSKYDLLVGPLQVLDLEPVVKNGSWEVVGDLSPTYQEMKVPDTKEAWPPCMYEDQAETWNYLKNLSPTGRKRSTWEKVKHLELYKKDSHDLIERRLTMEHLRQSGQSIEAFYELKEWRELAVYKNVQFTPIYSEIPVHLRGEAID